MRIELDIKAIELKALRRAIWGLYSEELARNPFRQRKSKIAEACEVLMDKVDRAGVKEKKS